MARNKSMGVRLGTPKAKNKTTQPASRVAPCSSSRAALAAAQIVMCAPNTDRVPCSECAFSVHLDGNTALMEYDPVIDGIYQCQLLPSVFRVTYPHDHWCGFGARKEPTNE